MTAVEFGTTSVQTDRCVYSHPINDAILTLLPQFDKLIYSYMLFNALFLTIGCVEFLLLLLFFTFLAHSAVLAFSLAVVFLTFFSYFILRTYVQARKQEQFEELRNEYIQSAKSLLGYQNDSPTHYLALADACTKLANKLKNRENSFYHPPASFKSLAPYFEKLSYWFHWYDVHQMQELLLQTAIEEHIKLVKREPTNMAIHTALANVYIMLSGLYVLPEDEAEQDAKWTSRGSMAAVLEEKFRTTAQSAIEEFKILNSFAPDDPWIHTQLAYSYRDLKMPLEEIKEYEILLKLMPEDRDTLFKLGIRYFQQGLNASGLRMYQRLKQLDSKRAEDLILFFGACTKAS